VALRRSVEAQRSVRLRQRGPSRLILVDANSGFATSSCPFRGVHRSVVRPSLVGSTCRE